MSRDTEHPKADDVLDLRASRESLTSAAVSYTHLTLPTNREV